MSYQIRCTGPSGSTFLVGDVFATRCQAEEIRESWERWCGGTYKYTVEEVPDAPEPGSVAARHVEILRERVKELEEGLATVTANLAKAPSVPVGASEAPGEGGDSDRRRLEVLERYLEGDTFRGIWKKVIGPFAAGINIEGQHFEAPTLAALADKLAEKEGKP